MARADTKHGTPVNKNFCSGRPVDYHAGHDNTRKGPCGVGGEEVQMRAVCKSGKYPDDGSDEDNTYAKFSPSADFRLMVQNPALFGTFKPGQKYYVDLTPAEETERQTAESRAPQ